MNGVAITLFVETRNVIINDRRYVSHTLKVQNNTGRDLKNLHFIAANVPSRNPGGTGYRNIKNAAGTLLTDPVIARDIIPLNALPNGATTVTPDPARSSFQVFTPAEAQALESAALSSDPGKISNDILEYGFHAYQPNGSQTIPNGGTAEITIAFSWGVRTPEDTIKNASFVFEMFELDAARVTRASNESTEMAAQRARASGVAQLGLMGSGSEAFADLQIVRSLTPKFFTPDPVEDDLIPADQITAEIDSSVTPPTAFAGGEVNFSGAGSVGNDLTYHWDFGDGTSIDSDPETSGDAIHTYDEPGYYDAKLTVFDGPTNTTKASTVRIAIMPDIHDIPSSRFVGHGRPVVLDVAYPVEGLTYEWKFDDGAVLTGGRIAKSFTRPGFQDLTLTVYDDRTGVGTYGSRNILEQRQVRVKHIIPRPTADIYGGQSGVSTIYLDGSTYSRVVDGNVTYEWDFGDGTKGTGDIVNHTYAKNGRYGITLTITDAFGQKDSSHTVVILGDRPEEEPSTAIHADLGDGGIRSQSLQRVPGDITVKTALSNANSRAKRSVIYLPGKPKGRTGTGRLSSQSMETVDFGYPFVLPRNPRDLQVDTRALGYSNGFSAASVSTAWNGTSRSKGNGWDLRDCTTVEPVVCDGARFNRSFFPEQLKDGINNHTFTFNGYGNQPVTFDTTYAAFSGLRVPRVSLNIIPDAQLPDLEVREYTFEDGGRKQLLAQVNIPESQITSGGYIGFNIPIYAVDSAGRLLSEVSGVFGAQFGDSRIYSAPSESVMVNGRAEMLVYVPIDMFSDGLTQFDLTQVVVMAPGCGENNSFINAGFSLSGCQTVVATHDIPLTSLTSQSNGLRAQGLPTPPPGWLENLGVVNPKFFDMIGFGRTSKARQNFDSFLREYEGSVVGIVFSVFPYVGDSTDILVQLYKRATGQEVDPVIATLAVAGVALDFAVTPLGDVTTPLKVLYKSGGPISKEAIKALVDEARAGKLNVRDTYEFLKDSSGFLIKLGIIDTLNLKYKLTIDDALKLAKESSGSALSALRQYNFSFNKFRSFFPEGKYNKYHLLEVAKYGMFAPETAKAMAKCGSWCIALVGRVNETIAKKFTHKYEAIKYYESNFIKYTSSVFRPKIIIGLSNGTSLCKLDLIKRPTFPPAIRPQSSLISQGLPDDWEECLRFLNPVPFLAKNPGSENFIDAQVVDGFLYMLAVAKDKAGPRGRVLFEEVWEALGKHAIYGIRGVWKKDDEIGDNFVSFLRERERFSDEQAALRTWTGKMAQSKGFNRAKVSFGPKDQYGNFTSVDVYFYKD